MEIKQLAFGYLRLKPDEFWNLTLSEIIDMAEAVVEDEKRKIEEQLWIVAWQTAHLMNATGNFKKTITPEKLLGKSASKEIRYASAEEKKKALEEVKKKFGV